MFDKIHPYRWMLPVLLFALVVRIVLLWLYQQSDLASCLGLDPKYYYSSAIRIYYGEIKEGHGLFVGGPLYPYFLALLMHVFGVNYLRLRLVQCAIGVATTALVALLGERLFSRTVGVVAGLACTLCGPLLISELGFENEFLVTFLTVAAVNLLVTRRHTRWGVFASGLLLGLAALARGNQVFAVGFTILWLLLDAAPLRTRAVRSVLLTAGVCIAISPITIRNYILFHEFIPISAHGGYVFYLGNNPDASFHYVPLSFGGTSTEGEFPAAWNEASRRTGQNLSPNGASSYWFREGLRFIAAEPGKFLVNLGNKIRAFANNYEIPDNYSYTFIKGMIPFVSWLFVSFGLILPLAFVGFFRIRNRERAILLVMPVTALLTVLIFYFNARFRTTAFPFFIILAAAGLVHLVELLRQRRLKALLPLAAGGCAFALFSFAPLKIDADGYLYNDYYFPYVQVGQCVESMDTTSALGYYRKAIALNPRRPEAHMRLGRLLYASGDFASATREFETMPANADALVELSHIAYSQRRPEQAIACLERALAIQPNLLSEYKTLASLYRSVGRVEDAKALLKKGLAIDPSYFKAYYDLSR
jgi:4-amino-4-deoxy-L-arabinose transferase-like glycosyltransferase